MYQKLLLIPSVRPLLVIMVFAHAVGKRFSFTEQFKLKLPFQLQLVHGET